MSPPADRCHVLLIDDDLRVWETIKSCLEQSCDVHRATTLEAAWRVLRRDSIHLVLMESRFSDGDGLTFLAEVRRARPTLPMVMVTAHGSEMLCASAFRLGIADYMRKPLATAALLEIVRRMVTDGPFHGRPATARLAMVHVAEQVEKGRLPNTLAERRVGEATRFIEDHYSERVTLGRVARIVGMGRFSLSRTFTRVMRRPLRTYLLEVRVARALELLRDPTRSITDIADAVGFADLSRFNKVFKKHTGLSPTGWRRAQSGMAKKDQKKSTNA